jgi:hypothetical protein
MSHSIQDILAPLDSHWDRIIRRPLSAKEVDKLQRRVGLPLPAPLRAYLMQVGLFQDLTCGQPIEVYDDFEDFVVGREHLAQILPGRKDEFFPFGLDGADNVFCLPVDAKAPCRIHFVDHETGKIAKKKEFGAWLQAVVAKVVRGIRRRPTNDRKVWCVQFSFQGTSFAELSKLLTKVGRLKAIDAGWRNVEKSSGMTSSDRRLELNGVPLKVGRLECKSWDGPMLSFDMQEPLQQGLEHSQIRKLHRLFKKSCPGYNLVDYGPLDMSEVEEVQ